MMLGKYPLLLALSCCLSELLMAATESQFDHSAWLDPSENYRLHWTVDHKDKSITFAAEVKTTGWIGFGISKGLTGTMKGSDIAIGWIDNSGKGHITDRYGIGQVKPLLDSKQDYTLISSSQNKTNTILKFKRKMDTCDKQDNPIDTVTTKVIYAWGDTKPAGADDSSLAYHNANKGSRSLSLLNFVKNSPVPAGAKNFTLMQKNITVPPKRTTYWCTPFRLSDIVKINSTKHIVEIAPVIQKRTEGLVHHMLLYGCSNDFDPKHLNVTGECYGNMPKSLSDCAGRSAIHGWAIGGTTFKFPDDVGYPIGGLNDYQYVLLETHFDNPNRRNDLVDTSGLRFYYTEPRKYPAATLTAGTRVNDNMLIPPEMKDWLNIGICPSQCTENIKGSQLEGGNTINLFSSFPHAHYAGRKIRTVLVRKGVAQQEVLRDDNYDFNFQQTYLLDKQIKMKAGDELFTYCNYNTEGRSSATTGGLGTLDEMCLNFIMYYPRVNLTDCQSQEAGVYWYFSRKYGGGTWKGKAWNNSMINELKQVMNNPKTVSTLCTGIGSYRYPINYLAKRPSITKQLPPKPSVCGPNSKSYNNTPSLVPILVILAASFTISGLSK